MKKIISSILHRPASAMLILGALIVFGISSVLGLRLEYFPDLQMPLQVVSIVYPGADADTIERLVTEPVEDLGKSLTDIDSISSTTHDNYTTIQFSYLYGTNLDDAYKELKTELDNLADTLPSECQTPVIMDVSLDSGATMSVAASMSQADDSTLNYIEDTIIPELEALGGVASVSVSGISSTYMRIVLDETKMEQYNISAESVRSAITAYDFSMPLGTVNMGSQEIALSSEEDINWQSALIHIPIQTPLGQVMELGDVVSFSNIYRSDADNISRYNGDTSVLINVTKKNNAATIQTCKNVTEALDRFANSELSFSVISSSADDIVASLTEVLKTLFIGIAFTMFILYLFFGDWKASLIVGSSMPLSLLLSAILLKTIGISFDLMTGTGMIIAIGMIVDNSIVIIENCFRQQKEETDFKSAVINGTTAMIPSIFASTLTTIVVYAPLCATSGMSSQMNQPLCWTVIFTMTSSFISAALIVPLLFVLVRPKEKEELKINRFLAWVEQRYEKIMVRFLAYPKRVLGSALLLFAASIVLATQLHMDLFPSNFDGSIEVQAVFRSGTKLELMDEQIKSMETALTNDSNFENITLDISENTAFLHAYANPDSRRTSDQAAEHYTEQFGAIPNMDISIIPTGATTGLSSLMSTGNRMTYTFGGDDLEQLKTGVSMAAVALEGIPGIMKVDYDLASDRTKGCLVINQQKALACGLSRALISAQIRYLVSGLMVETVHYNDKDYDIVLEYPEGKYSELSKLMDYKLTAPDGSMVILSDIAEIQYKNTVSTISRRNGEFETELHVIASTDGKQSASAQIKTAFGQLELPQGVHQKSSSMDETMSSEMGSMGFAILYAVVLVFIVMALQFGSAKQSLMVMSCIPFSLIGCFLLLFLSDAPLSMMAMMGFLMLVGMVVNNGILLLDSVNLLAAKMPLREALIHAGTLRLRPILMTTLTTVLSMLPMIFSTDSGMSMMLGMAYVIIGGLCSSTILALFVMPPFYLLFNKEKSS